MSEVVEAAPAEVIEAPSAPERSPRFEIPEFTKQQEKAAEKPVAEAPKADSPPATGDETPPETPKTPDPEAEKAAKARADRQKQNRLYKQIAEEKVRREAAEKELEKLRQPVQPVRDGGPNPADFTDLNEYTKAVREHERKEAVKEYEQQAALKQSQVRQTKLSQDWESAVDKASEKYEDFDQVVGELKPTTPWAIAIMQSENAADVAYYLGQNIKEAQRIIALDPIAQIREIGKLETKLLAAPPAVKAASKAPAPITPVSGSGNVAPQIESGMDMAKFLKLRNKQLGRT